MKEANADQHIEASTTEKQADVNEEESLRSEDTAVPPPPPLSPFPNPHFPAFKTFLTHQTWYYRSKVHRFQKHFDACAAKYQSLEKLLDPNATVQSHKPEEDASTNVEPEAKRRRLETRRGRPDQEQSSNPSRTRERRLAGLLLGHLQKSKQELEQKSEAQKRKDEHQKKIDQREHEQKVANAKEQIVRVKQEYEDKEKIIQDLKTKLQRYEDMLEKFWQQDEACKTCHFLSTKSRPVLFYLPNKLLPEQEQKIIEKKTRANEVVKEFEDQFAKFLQEMNIDQESVLSGNYRGGRKRQSSEKRRSEQPPKPAIKRKREEEESGSDSDSDDRHPNRVDSVSTSNLQPLITDQETKNNGEDWGTWGTDQ